MAFIGADRKTVSVQCLQFHHDGQWRLSEYVEPTLMDKLSGFYRGFDFVHVAWGPSGNELLVIDSCGRIAVGYVFVALNRIIIQKLLNYDPDDNFNAVVALKWLKQVKKPVSQLQRSRFSSNPPQDSPHRSSSEGEKSLEISTISLRISRAIFSHSKAGVSHCN